jgi:hypothetical protein
MSSSKVLDAVDDMLPKSWNFETSTECYEIVLLCVDSDGVPIEEPQIHIPFDKELMENILLYMIDANVGYTKSNLFVNYLSR